MNVDYRSGPKRFRHVGTDFNADNWKDVREISKLNAVDDSACFKLVGLMTHLKTELEKII